MKVKVADGTQVNVEGVVHGAGKTVELPDEEAQRLLAAGVVVEVESKSTSKK